MSKSEGSFRVGISHKLFKRLLVPFLVLCFGWVEANAAILSWSGGGVNGSWNNSANWGFVGTPANGDTLIFPAGQPMQANSNNIASLVLNQIRFAGAGGGYVITGNAFTLTNSLMATNSVGVNSIGNAITLSTTDIVINVAVTLTLSGNLGGSVGVTKTGTGTLIYGGNSNPYTGTTRVNAGVLQLSCGGFDVAFGGPLIISDGSTSATVRLGLSFEIPENVPITLNDGGLLDLNNVSDNIGTNVTMNNSCTIASGTATLTLGANCVVTCNPGFLASGTISGNLNISSGTCTFNVSAGGFLSGSLLIPAVVSGTAAIVKNGTGYMSLSGANTFTGLVTANGGTLGVSHSTALGTAAAGTVINNPATLEIFGGIAVNGEALTIASTGTGISVANGANSWTAGVTLSTDTTINVASGASLDIIGTLSGPGGFTKVGTGTLTLSGNTANSYAGDTIVNEGLLQLNKSAGFAIQNGSLTIGDGVGGPSSDIVRYTGGSGSMIFISVPITIASSGWLDLNNFTDDVGNITMTGAQITTGTGTLQPGNISTLASPDQSSTISGIMFLSGFRTITVENGGMFYDLVVSARITDGGTGFRIVAGAVDGAFIRVTSSNSFTGPLTISDLTVDVENPFALGTTAGGTIVTNTGELFVFTAITNETATLYPGTFFTAQGNRRWNGPVILAGNATVSAFSSGSRFDIDGAISGTGNLAVRPTGGTNVFSGSTSNSYVGTTTISTAGDVELNKTTSNGAIPGNLVLSSAVLHLLNDEQIVDSADVQINASGTFDFATSFESIDTLHGTGNVIFGINGYLNIGFNDGSSTFDGLMSGTGFIGGYTVGKYGTGTFTTTANNTYLNQSRAIAGTFLINGVQPHNPVSVQSAGTFGGTGTVGIITCSGNLTPGTSPGILNSSNVIFTATGDYFVELNGPIAGSGYDQLNVTGTNSLANAVLHVTANPSSPVKAGDQFVILKNDGAEAVGGTFSGLPNGSSITAGAYTFTISYAGDTGNDVVLTLTNIPAAGRASFVSLGNGNHAIDPDECNFLSLVISNKTGVAMSGVTATLSTITPAVAINQPYSDYPNVPASGNRTNITPFQISTLPSFVCGNAIDLELTVNTATHGSFIVPFVLLSGEPSLSPSRFDISVVTNIPDTGTIESTNFVGVFGGPLSKVAVSLWLTHPVDSDLSISLISPTGIEVNLTSGNGAGANFGSACAPDGSRTTFDDAAATSITAGIPPFVGTFRPESSLAAFVNASATGNWRLKITDSFGGSLGALRCWSLFLYGTACASGGGACDFCLPTISGSITNTDLTQVNRVYRDAVAASCGSPKAWSGLFGDTGTNFHYDVYSFTNTTADEACVTVELESSSDLMAIAYLNSFNPSNISNNFAGDSGYSISTSPAGSALTFSFSVAAGAKFLVVVNEVTENTPGNQPYTLHISGLPCPPPDLAITPLPSTNNIVRIDWPTWAGGFKLESLTNLTTTNWVLVPNEPIAANNRYNVTNSASLPTNRFYRLHKP